MPARPKYYFFFFNDTATTEIYTLSLHDALPIYKITGTPTVIFTDNTRVPGAISAQEVEKNRSEEHTSELQSPCNLVCRLLLEKKSTASRVVGEHQRAGRPLTRLHV